LIATERTDIASIRNGVRSLCSQFGDLYWRDVDQGRRYPEEFVGRLTEGGWLAVLVPVEYGGAGLGVAEGSVILEEINACGGNAAACHAQMYTMSAVARHASNEQKLRYLPEIAAGRLRLQSMAVTEPDAGVDTTRISTRARRDGDTYVITGEKVFTSRVQHSDLILVLARTKPYDVGSRTAGISLFLVDKREVGDALEVRPITTMVNHETNALSFHDLRVPASALIGEEGRGFHYLLDGLNAERILIAAESVGDARWFVERASRYANQRVVFGRPIGANQGVQFPIARAYAHLRAASAVRWEAAALFDSGAACGIEANMAKLLAAEAAWEAGQVAMATHGGHGLAVDMDVERKFRESWLFMVAPVPNNLVLAHLAERALGLPRSYGQ
jgi:acyl-CoA dehydrogenase